MRLRRWRWTDFWLCFMGWVKVMASVDGYSTGSMNHLWKDLKHRHSCRQIQPILTSLN